jgi:hypothetical protein
MAAITYAVGHPALPEIIGSDGGRYAEDEDENQECFHCGIPCERLRREQHSRVWKSCRKRRQEPVSDLWWMQRTRERGTASNQTMLHVMRCERFSKIALSAGVLLLVSALAQTARCEQKPRFAPERTIVITKGGTYSGHWDSDDPKVAAVYIHTDEPVVLRDSAVSGRGDLIQIRGVKQGANVTIENVTGIGLYARVSGTERGSFVTGGYITSLVVRHCTMKGVAFGVKVVGARPSLLKIMNNKAIDLEDRASDGHGGSLAARPVLGHFVLLNQVVAANGAEIAWNEVLQTIGSSSTEDVFNIYSSQGAAGHPIWLHDNYMEGASSPSNPRNYTGVGMITDGTTANGNLPPAFVLMENNQVLKTAGGGIAIAAGHDIQARGNSVVSCGMTADGKWYAYSGIAAYIWNYYRSDSFYNNSITSTTGGMVNPGPNQSLVSHNLWLNRPGISSTTVSVAENHFTDPCLVKGKVSLQAEAQERARWRSKLAEAGQTVGAGAVHGGRMRRARS